MTLTLQTPTDAPRLLSSHEVITSTRLSHGLALPQSYRRFAQEWGYGTLGGLLLLYVPLDDATYCDSLQNRNRELAVFFGKALVEGYFELEPDGSAELVQRLVPFGASTYPR